MKAAAFVWIIAWVHLSAQDLVAQSKESADDDYDAKIKKVLEEKLENAKKQFRYLVNQDKAGFTGDYGSFLGRLAEAEKSVVEAGLELKQDPKHRIDFLKECLETIIPLEKKMKQRFDEHVKSSEPDYLLIRNRRLDLDYRILIEQRKQHKRAEGK